MDLRARRSRETSPDRARISMHQQKIKPIIRKVQVVYYICRNGHLEHPHYMEVLVSPNSQHIRLKDVMDRLTALRGNGMPSMYSWSCKRSYKNGFVWNDLSENDIIYPTEGAEYVLKGSELIKGCTDKLQEFRIINNKQTHIPEPNLYLKLKPNTPIQNRVSENRADDEEEDESYTSSNHSHCSRGVSTDEIKEARKKPTEITIDDDHSSPPSTTSSNVSDKAINIDSCSKRFGHELGIVVRTQSPVPNRHSILLQLIACGGGSIGAKKLQNVKQPMISSNGKNNNTSLRREVVCKNAAEDVTEDEMMINCMSMNPRFANLQSEEKEYFSGSIVEAMTEDGIAPVLKRSNSCNQDRSMKKDIEEEIETKTEKKAAAGMKGKCLPRNTISIFKTKQKVTNTTSTTPNLI